MMPGEKAKDFKGTFAKLLAYMGRYKLALIAVMIFAAGSTVFNIIGPKVLAKATTELFNGMMAKFAGTGGIDFQRIGQILLLLLGLYALSSLLSFIQGLLMTEVSQKLCYRFRQEISEKINRMPMAYFESRTVGEVLSRITNDVDTLGQSLGQSITTLITSVATILGILIMMLSISPMMTLIALVILPVSGGLIGVVVKHSQKYFIAQQNYLGKINGQIEEVYSGQNIVKAFNREEATLAEFGETNRILYQSAWKSQFISGMMQPIMAFVGNLGYVAVAVSGSMLAIRGVIEVGEIQAFIQYVKNFTQPITQVAQVSNMFQSTAAAAERVFEFLDEPEEDVIAEKAVGMEKAKMQGAVSFDHVRFGYQPEKTIIHDFSCEVLPGQTVAIVGPTGAGKTTMVKLLMRFYDVNSGAIRVDGQDVRNFNRSQLRENFGMVLQDTWLFHGTIMENIRYGRLDATDEEVIAAAKAAHVHHFIQTLPGGYQMELGEDASNVSQGQKQLLTIARAILADNPILILDEATSSVDTRTEIRIQKAMNNLMKGRTSFVIAHRLSTIRDADVILVMKDGDIIEQGNHEELMAKDGFYAELYNSQFEGQGTLETA
ncbi:ABC transporter ATP-binding protein [Acetatifactor aquisgranensis]|uniref:ABC transporter ATP-binding protein n=1 Tax=Acetatifactor aquisgranensis TaxID=2941233 RepID=UPI0020401B13|nr:ABC transporter ATP-binding protein [Acetatifactor aquisgranensis]MCI8541998.1 ABC transporter ATP-binding protein [Lachnospiraceae bacterium]